MSGDEVVAALDTLYPRVKTPLHHKDAFQLLVATVLSAQCTDAQVNSVTPILFENFPTAKSLSKASLSELEKLVKSTGFYHVKAKRIRQISRDLVRNFHGEIPQKLEELIKLPGVGRKTANIVLSVGFDKIEGVAVDTHVLRLSQRIGLSSEKIPEKIEQDLMHITSKRHWPRLSLLLILHGRTVCNARRPKCEICILSKKCLYYAKRDK